MLVVKLPTNRVLVVVWKVIITLTQTHSIQFQRRELSLAVELGMISLSLGLCVIRNLFILSKLLIGK